MERYFKKQVTADLSRKMVFLGGPRQVGKTTLAKSLTQNNKGYLNWDIDEHREKILNGEFPPSSLWIFDEIHKYRRWRNFLKGLYDQHRGKKRILITGSARLDYYRFGGDSLQGRYHYLRLHPLSCAELKLQTSKELQDLMKLGGFPEPFLEGSEVEAKRWSREYRIRLFRDDIRSVERVEDLDHMELLFMRLPDLVGSPLSINALREDLQRSHKTVSNWLRILERFYAIFRLTPFGSPRLRAVKKEQKHYHFDWSLVKEPGLRFENMIACHLLKWVHFQQDTQGRELDLHYFRDVDKREVDFVITEDQKPILLVECKLSDEAINPALYYLKERTRAPEVWQIHALGNKDYESAEGIRVAPAIEFLKNLV